MLMNMFYSSTGNIFGGTVVVLISKRKMYFLKAFLKSFLVIHKKKKC